MGQICDSNVGDNPEARFDKAALFLAVQRQFAARLLPQQKPRSAEPSQTNHRQLDTVTQSLLACFLAYMLASELTDGGGGTAPSADRPVSRRPASAFPPSSSSCHAWQTRKSAHNRVKRHVFFFYSVFPQHTYLGWSATSLFFSPSCARFNQSCTDSGAPTGALFFRTNICGCRRARKGVVVAVGAG